MTHTLKFDAWTDDNQSSLVKFVLLYQAFLGTADNPNRARSLEETRHAIKILDGFSEISDVVNAGTMNESRVLKRDGGEIKVNDAELSLLKRSVETWVGTVPFAMARSAMELKDFVDGAASV